MKRIKITVTMDVSDKFFEEEAKEVKADILSGQFQLSLINKEKGITKCTAEFIEIK